MNTERHKYCLANIPTQEFIIILTLHLSILYVKQKYTFNGKVCTMFIQRDNIDIILIIIW